MALLAMFAACQNDEFDNASTFDNDPNAVQVNATIRGLQTRVNTSGNGDTWEQGDCFKVTNVTTGAIDGKEQAIFTYNATSQKFELTGTDYMVWADGENTFQAYYPYSKDNGGDSYTNFTLPTEQNSEESLKKADYMTAETKATKTENSRSINLNFSHQLAKVTVKITQYKDEFPEASRPKITKATFTVPTTSSAEATKTITVQDGATTISGWANSETFMAILPLGTYNSMTVFLKLGNDENEELFTVLPNSFLTTEGFKAGQAYTLNLTVGKDIITINSVKVNDWTTSNLSGGTAEEETDGPDASTYTIKTSKEGQIKDNPAWIKEAINGGTSLIITGPMNSDDIEAIANYLKANSESVISLDLSDAEITNIAYPGFYGAYSPGLMDLRAKSLGEVTLPKGLTEIGQMAFSNCPAFTIANWNELTLLTTIGMSAFMSSGLSGDITLPESIETIGGKAFYETAITSIVFPSSITTIGEQMFYRSQNLKTVTFKGNVTSFDIRVFEGCSALEEIDLSACTAVPTYQDATIFEGFSDSEMKGITLKVKSSLVESFKAEAVWGKFDVTAVE